MITQIALKRLTKSDLTLFEHQFRTLNVGNQKALNLNANVFVDKLYPNFPDIASKTNNEVSIPLSLYGPGLKSGYHLTRKITKKALSYKNWRLNGAYIPNPDDDPGRFDVLEENDLALIAFTGDDRPAAIDLFLLSKNVLDDASLYGALYSVLGTRRMIPLDKAMLADTLSTIGVSEEHPVHKLLFRPALEAAIEDAALGGETGARTLARRRAGVRLTAADLVRAKERAACIGRKGENLVQVLLQQQQAARKLKSFTWVAENNAVAPYDFLTESASGERILADAKSTEGSFDRTIHISSAELTEAADAKERYDLYRVFDLNENGGRIRICEDIRDFARRIRGVMEALPKGVAADGFSVDPAVLTWGPEIMVEWPEEEPHIDPGG